MIKKGKAKIVVLGGIAAVLVISLNVFSGNATPVIKPMQTMKPAQIKPNKYSAIASGLVDVKGGVTYISAHMDGIISSVLVQEGDTVKKGQILAYQESRSEIIAIQTAEMELKNARARYELNTLNTKSAERDIKELTPLFEIGAIQKNEFDSAKDRLAKNEIEKKINEVSILTAQARLQNAEFTLSQRTIRSTVNGTVVEVEASAGYGASTLNVSSLFTIIPDGKRVVRSQVAVIDIKKLFMGQKVEIYSFSDQKNAYQAEIVHISQLIKTKNKDVAGTDSNDQLINVVLELGQNDFLIGQKVQARFVHSTSSLEQG